MPKPHVIVLAITHQGLTKQQAATKYKVSIRWINILLNRYRDGGLAALEPIPKTPKTNPRATPENMVQLVLETRYQLVSDGFDGGPISIHWYLTQQKANPPSRATIWRILKRNDAITPEPKKRPKSSYIRFEATLPNETWQADFTHWKLADGSDVEVLTWLDDHSRFFLGFTIHQPVLGPDVVNGFLEMVTKYGPPQSTLTDNGLVFTSRFIGGKNPFEYKLAEMGVKQKNGSPGRPTTQGKVERLNGTIKKYLEQKPLPQTPEELRQQLERFKTIYNEKRPHSSIKYKTPKTVYEAKPKAHPLGVEFDGHRVRYDIIDNSGKVTVRRDGMLHKLGVGRAYATQPVIMLIDDKTVTVTNRLTGEVLSEHTIDPVKKYWPKH